jgi:hypothetical protein
VIRPVSRVGLLLLFLLGLAARGAGPVPAPEDEPALCAEVLGREQGEPLDALARAEQERWTVARNAERRGRRLMRSTVGMGESQRSLRAVAELERLDRAFAAAVREARILCGCRQRRGDPYREDCDRLYRPWIPPEGGP